MSKLSIHHPEISIFGNRRYSVPERRTGSGLKLRRERFIRYFNEYSRYISFKTVNTIEFYLSTFRVGSLYVGTPIRVPRNQVYEFKPWTEVPLGITHWNTLIEIEGVELKGVDILRLSLSLLKYQKKKKLFSTSYWSSFYDSYKNKRVRFDIKLPRWFSSVSYVKCKNFSFQRIVDVSLW